MNKILLALVAVFLGLIANAQPFQKNEAASSILTNVSKGCAVWMDYDLDGDYDILVTGESQNGPVTKIFNQDNGIFEDILTQLPALKCSDASWSDFDNDNDPDLFISGVTFQEKGVTPSSFLFKNNNGVFEQISTEITAVYSGSSGWGDLDNDGDYDLVLVGNTGEEGITKIFRNDGNDEFSEVNTDFVGIYNGEVDLGDYDNDMDIDILVCGFFKNAQGDSLRTLKVYRNDGDYSFTSISGPLVGMGQSNVSWWDYDSDGDLDIIANGSTDAPTYLVYIYQNLGNDVFSNIGIEIFGTVNGSVSCGDYDCDGDQDFLLTGFSSYNSQPVTVLYRNVATNLFNKDYSVVLPAIENSSSAWCDYDNSGNLDMLITGSETLAGEITTAVYDNKNLLINTPPSVPENLNAEVIDGNIILGWDASSDVETPAAGLTYNLRVGTTPGGSQIVSSMTSETGHRSIVSYGNVFHNTSWQLKNLQPGTYYFSVQSVDNGFESSSFSEEASFIVLSTGSLENDIKPIPFDVLISPNPASDYVVIELSVEKNLEADLTVFNIAGRELRVLKMRGYIDGKISAIWDMKDNSGKSVSNGIYLVVIECSGKKITSKIVVKNR